MVARARPDGGQGRLGDPFHGPQFDGRARHEATGVAATEGRAATPVLDEADGPDEGSVRFGPDALDRLFGHFDDFRSRVKENPRKRLQFVLPKQVRKGFFPSNKMNLILNPAIFEGHGDSRHNLIGTLVPAHGVDGDRFIFPGISHQKTKTASNEAVQVQNLCDKLG